jgi:hypothetical protein
MSRMSTSDDHRAERERVAVHDPPEDADLLELLIGDGQPLGSVAEIALAVRDGEVTFPMVMKALYYQYPQWSRSASPPRRELYRELYVRALSQFTQRHEGIADSYFANEFGAGVALTGKDELFSSIWWDEFKFDTNPARALEADINDLRLKAELYLSANHRRICMQRLIRLYKPLISTQVFGLNTSVGMAWTLRRADGHTRAIWPISHSSDRSLTPFGSRISTLGAPEDKRVT